MEPAELPELEQQATREVIQLQEDLDIDVIVDGEMYRGDMAEYFAQQMSGFETTGLVRSYGNRYYHKPIVSGAIERPNAITVDWWKYAQTLTDEAGEGDAHRAVHDDGLVIRGVLPEPPRMHARARPGDS